MALVFLACSWIFFSIVSNKEPRFNLPSLPFLLIAATCGLHIALPRLTRLAVPALAAGLAIQALFFTQVPIVAGFKEAALAAQSLTPKNGKTMISAHRDGSFIYDMRALGDRRDIAIRRADKLFVEINIMRELGIKDRNYDQQAILALLNREDISTIVAQTGYLADQPSMRNLQAMLETGSYYEKVQTIALTGNTRADEKELVVYKRIAQR
jgi:hypothetical protein